MGAKIEASSSFLDSLLDMGYLSRSSSPGSSGIQPFHHPQRHCDRQCSSYANSEQCSCSERSLVGSCSVLLRPHFDRPASCYQCFYQKEASMLHSLCIVYSSSNSYSSTCTCTCTVPVSDDGNVFGQLVVYGTAGILRHRSSCFNQATHCQTAASSLTADHDNEKLRHHLISVFFKTINHSINTEAATITAMKANSPLTAALGVLLLLGLTTPSTCFTTSTNSLRTSSFKLELPTSVSTTSSRRKRTASSSWYMHMGHSHSHSHSHVDHQQSSSSSSTPKQARFKRRRLYALLLFCGLAILGPPLARHQALAKSDIAAFSLTSTALFLMEPLRNQVKYIIKRFRNLGQGIAKHSTPLTAQYFFKNENAGDRVTLLG